MGILFTLILLFSLCSLVSYLALQRGRDPTNWFFIALFLGLFSLPLLYLMPKLHEEKPKVPPPLDPLAGKNWFYLNEKREIKGPVASKEIRRLLKEQTLTSESLLWAEGMSDWVKINILDNRI